MITEYDTFDDDDNDTYSNGDHCKMQARVPFY